MKFKWLMSLRARLVALVVICTLPALAFVAYAAVTNYRIQAGYAYGAGWLAVNDVISRYQSLVTDGRNLLPMMAELPAISASPSKCNHELTALRARLPLYDNLLVVRPDGKLFCSAAPFVGGVSLASRGWFQQVLATHRFAVEVVSRGILTHRGQLVIAMPYFTARGQLLGILNAVIPATALQPPQNSMLLAQHTNVTVFSGTGTVLVSYPQAAGMVDSDQSRSALFRAVASRHQLGTRMVTGLDGQRRFYALEHFATGKPGNVIYVAGGVDLSFIRRYVVLPLVRDLAFIVAIALFIILCVWLFTSSLITRNIRPLLGTLQRIGAGEWQARTGLAEAPGEFGEIARGVDHMAENLQARVTAQQAAEQRLANSERQYRELVEQSVLGILVVRPPTQISFANQALCRITGFRHDQLLQLSLTGLVEPEDIGVVQRVQQLREGESLGFQCHIRSHAGAPLLIEVSARRLGNQNIQMLINDISARVAAERRFAEERSFALNALNTLPGIFFVVDSHGRLLRWNRRLEDVSGYSMEELRHRAYSELVPAELRASAAAALARVLSGMRTEGAVEILCKGGARVPYYIVNDRLESQGQVCAVGVGVDISERKQAEQRMNKYLEELQQLSARLLAVQEEERRGIARELHDEFGQGLTAALMHLKELTVAAGAGALAAPLRQVAAILTQLTQQVRTLSLNLRPSVLDDLGLLAAVRWYLRERVESAGLRVTLEADDRLPRLDSLIETTCFRVLQGALTNVLRHAQARHVWVGLHLADGELRLSVGDDGRGFDVQRARRDAIGGKSLGLLGMEERVRLAGGAFAITSKSGGGTEVRITLPAT